MMPSYRYASALVVLGLLTSAAAFCSAPIPSAVEARARQLVRAYSDLVEELNLERIPGNLPDYPEVTEGVQRLGERLEVLSRFAARAGGALPAEWDKFAADLAACESDLTRLRRLSLPLRLYALHRSQEIRRPGYGVAVETSLRKLPREKRLADASVRDFVELIGAVGETTSAQLLVVPIRQALRGVGVTWTGLTGLSGDLPGSCLQVHPVGYLRLEKTSPKRASGGWWPDMLMPPAPVDVSQDEVQPLWVTLTIPADQRPGRYEGTLTVRPSNAGPVQVRVIARVRGYSLPALPPVATSLGISAAQVARLPGLSGNPLDPRCQEAFRQQCAALLHNRLAPGLGTEYLPASGGGEAASLAVWESNLDYCLKRGQTTLRLADWPLTPERLSWVKSLAAIVARKQIPQVLVAARSPLTPAQRAAGRSDLAALREILPGLRVLQVLGAGESLPSDPSFAQIWCPLPGQGDPDFLLARSQAGEAIWWQMALEDAAAPLAAEQSALRNRAFFWQMAVSGVAGLFADLINDWESPAGITQPADPASRPGAGYLLYPEREGKPVQSLRLALCRDGLEDLTALQLLRERATRSASAAKLWQRIQETLPALQRPGADPQVLLDLRREVDTILESPPTP